MNVPTLSVSTCIVLLNSPVRRRIVLRYKISQSLQTIATIDSNRETIILMSARAAAVYDGGLKTISRDQHGQHLRGVAAWLACLHLLTNEHTRRCTNYAVIIIIMLIMWALRARTC